MLEGIKERKTEGKNRWFNRSACVCVCVCGCLYMGIVYPTIFVVSLNCHHAKNQCVYSSLIKTIKYPTIRVLALLVKVFVFLLHYCSVLPLFNIGQSFVILNLL